MHTHKPAAKLSILGTLNSIQVQKSFLAEGWNDTGSDYWVTVPERNFQMAIRTFKCNQNYISWNVKHFPYLSTSQNKKEGQNTLKES